MTFACRSSVADGQLLPVERAIALCAGIRFSCQAVVLGLHGSKI